jgi:hypothetical protein
MSAPRVAPAAAVPAEATVRMSRTVIALVAGLHLMVRRLATCVAASASPMMVWPASCAGMLLRRRRRRRHRHRVVTTATTPFVLLAVLAVALAAEVTARMSRTATARTAGTRLKVRRLAICAARSASMMTACPARLAGVVRRCQWISLAWPFQCPFQTWPQCPFQCQT